MKTSTKIFSNSIIVILAGILFTAISFRIFAPNEFFENFSLFNDPIIQGNGKTVRQSINAAGFNSMNAQGKLDITLQPGNQESVILRTDENLVPHISIETKGNALDMKTLANLTPLPHVAITSNNISEINLSGKTILHANDVNSQQLSIIMNGKSICYLQSNTKILKINLNGKSELHADVNQADNVTLLVNGKGDLYLTGKTNNLTISSHGKSTVHASELVANNVVLNSAGKSNVTIHAVKTLSVIAVGKSEVKYSGNPIITRETAGESTLEKQ